MTTGSTSLCKPFVDDHGRYKNTDIAKVLLNELSLNRTDYYSRVPGVRCVRSEFTNFLDLYGACLTTFYTCYDSIELKPIAIFDSQLAGMIVSDNVFFVPALVPDNEEDRVKEFFTLLADAVVTTRRKLVFELPDWADGLLFPAESSLHEEKTKALAQIENIETRLGIYKKYKKALVQGDEQLVDTVRTILEEGYQLKVDATDEYKEDLKIVSDDGTRLVFCEVKGVGGGVKREFINQADSHRERAGLPADFPTMLIVNTHIKNTRILAEKDKDVPAEQVAHAKKQNVLVMRTLDLLRLLCLLERGILKENILDLFRGPGGWLRVSSDKWELIQGQVQDKQGPSADAPSDECSP